MLILPKITATGGKEGSFESYVRQNYTAGKLWGEKTLSDCFRIYDQENSDYPLVIDYYAGRFCVSYRAKGGEDSEPTPFFEQEVKRLLSRIFGIKETAIYFRTRIKQKQTRQYEKKEASGEFFIVYEYGVKFYINLKDYLDTGLFLDHRETRQLVAKQAKGKRILNLFAYTASFSVHAAKQGAVHTKSVDLSNTYCQWAQDNFMLNDLLSPSNEIIREDCLKFLKDEVDKRAQYDLIVIDPPTISRSKRMDDFFDIQEHYTYLIQKALQILSPGGTLYFSTNSRNFIFDSKQFSSAREVSEQTIPFDFKDKKIHRCWVLSG